MVAHAHRLVEFLWANFTSLSTPQFWRELAAVAFVPVRSPLNGKVTAYAYTQVADAAHKNLCWTVLPVLLPFQVSQSACVQARSTNNCVWL